MSLTSTAEAPNETNSNSEADTSVEPKKHSLSPLMVAAHVVLNVSSHRVLRMVLSDQVAIQEPRAVEAPKKGKTAVEEPVRFDSFVSFRLQVVDVAVDGRVSRLCELLVDRLAGEHSCEHALAAELCEQGDWLAAASPGGVRLYSLPAAFSEPPAEALLRLELASERGLLAGCRPLRAFLLPPSPGPGTPETLPQLALLPRDGNWAALLGLRALGPSPALGCFEVARWGLSAFPCCSLLLALQPLRCLALGLSDGSVAFLSLSGGVRAFLGSPGKHPARVSSLLLLRTPLGPGPVVSAGLDGSLCFFTLPPSPGPREGFSPLFMQTPLLGDFRQDLPPGSQCRALKPCGPAALMAFFSCGSAAAYEWTAGRACLRGSASLWQRHPLQPLQRRRLAPGGGPLLGVRGPLLLLLLQDPDLGKWLGAFPLGGFFASPRDPDPAPDPFVSFPGPSKKASASFKPVTRARLQAQDLASSVGSRALPPDSEKVREALRALPLPVLPDKALFKEVVGGRLQRASRKARLLSSLNDLLTYM